MIKENKNTWHTFAHPDLMQKLINEGFVLDDASYVALSDGDNWEIYQKEELITTDYGIPTYTLTEMLFKLLEWIYIKNEDGTTEFSGPLFFIKDAPFYIFGYKNTLENCLRKEIAFCTENPIESAVNLLAYCKKNNLGYVKNIGL